MVKRVAVFVAPNEAPNLRLPESTTAVAFETVLVAPEARNVRRHVRAAIANGDFTAAMSAFLADDETGLLVLETLAELRVPIISCKPTHVAWSRKELKMQCFYSGVTTNGFRFVSKSEFASNPTAAVAGLKYPVVVRRLIDTGVPTSSDASLFSEGDLIRYLSELYFRTVDTIALVEEVPTYGVRFVVVVGEGGGASTLGASDGVAVLPSVVEIFGKKSAEPLVVGSHNAVTASAVAAHSKAINEACRKVFKVAFDSVGYVSFEFIAHCKDPETSTSFDSLSLVSVTPNCNILSQVSKDVDGGSRESVDMLEQLCDVPVAGWLAALVECAVNRHREPTFDVGFDPAAKGYFVRSYRALAKGETVFEDEGRAFPIVTRGHVERTWSEEDRVTFSRYAWPIDDAGHVYAIWENEPRTWRPINHSCDPNLCFAEGYSLNVIARRDIAKGEDLTLDYATFCDLTMQPFQCFCRSAMCRGRIVPDPEALKRYGTNAWHRSAARVAAS
jgi:hypothetical protein